MNPWMEKGEKQLYCKGNVLVAFIEPSELLWISVKAANTTYMKEETNIAWAITVPEMIKKKGG